MTAILLHRSVCRLVQHPAQIFIALAERLLWFSSARSSFPGQVPTQEVNSAAEGNVLACTPTSAMICCAESTPKPGTSASRITAVLMRFHGLRDQRFGLGDLPVNQLQPFQP
jgi:hypothetical protein